MSRQINPDKATNKQPNSPRDERRQRQAEALRENLKRRKAQQRARAAHSDDSDNG